jgi:hypothetical protein
MDCEKVAVEKIIKMKDSRILMNRFIEMKFSMARRNDLSFSGCQIYYFCAMYLRWIFGIDLKKRSPG